MGKFYTGLFGQDVQEGFAALFSDTPPDEEWLLIVSPATPQVPMRLYGNIEADVNVEACERDGVRIARIPCLAGSVYVDEGSFLAFYKGADATGEKLIRIFSDALETFGLTSENIGNDIIVNGKKFVGFYPIEAKPYDFNAFGIVGNVSTPGELFPTYLKPRMDKIARHGENHMVNRVGTIADLVPGLTPQKLLQAIAETWPSAVERTPEETVCLTRFEQERAVFNSRAWIYHHLRPEEVYKVQDVVFANGNTITVDEVQGNTVSGREVLAFSIPEQTGVTFDELKTIFTDTEATQSISITYRDQTGEEAQSTRINAQTGFVVPVSLSYENGHFLMTLGKRTEQEAMYQELLERMALLEKAAGNAKV